MIFIILLYFLMHLLLTKIEAAGNNENASAEWGDSKRASSSSVGNSMAMCGNYKVSVPLRYKSDTNGEEIELMTTDGQIEAGAHGKFYVGFTGSKHRLSNLPTNECVAIKKIGSSERDHYCNSVRVLNQIQSRISRAQRRHIAKLFDAGYEQKTKYFIIVSELGDETLKERLYGENRKFSNEEMVMKIVVPLVELHKVAMHLDIKPSNYVFVKNQNDDNDALKLIDFDGADLLFADDQQNQCKIPEVAVHTMQYMSPEQDEHIFKQRTKLSVKADIWSVGMIVYEIILQNKHYDYLFSKEEDMSVADVLYYIGKCYRGYRIWQDGNEKAEFRRLNFDTDNEWVDKSNYADTLAHILRTAADWPLLFHLIINTLNTDPAQRMSAAAIVYFLDGQCIPSTSAQIANVSVLPLFQNVTVERLRRIFEDKSVKIQRDHKMLSLLSLVEEKQGKALEQLKKRSSICETKNFLLNSSMAQKAHENIEADLGAQHFGRTASRAAITYTEQINNNAKVPFGGKKLFKQKDKLAINASDQSSYEDKTLKDKIKQLIFSKSPKFERLKKYAREEGDGPFLGRR